jgi:hypothetical protein
MSMCLPELTAGKIDQQEISDIEQGSGFATLFVLDPFVLVMNNWLLNVINDYQQCYTAYVVANMPVKDAHLLLDSSFSDYIRGCCYSLGCDATVEYIVDGEVVMRNEYGWDDGSYSMTFKVYCRPDTLALLADRLSDASSDAPLIVVSPDDSHEWGFSAHKSIGTCDALEDAHDYLTNR